MIEPNLFLDAVKEGGYNFFCGVPCSYLTPFINAAISDPELDYIAATSEGEAVAIAAGAWLAGRKTVVMFQNSGLGNAVNPLTSLNYPFRIPTMLITTLRGEPGLKDEPQHELMGRITSNLLQTIEIPHSDFPSTPYSIKDTLSIATEYMQNDSLPYAFVMKKGMVADNNTKLPSLPRRSAGEVYDLTMQDGLCTRFEALEKLLSIIPESAAVIATTGKCGRELFTLSDREQHLYKVGSMGCAGAMGLGVALNTHKKTIVIDGDGALLMKMGSLATIGTYSPKNLIHIVLDNESYDSTGGQSTISPNVDFAQIAISSGYRHGYICDSLSGFNEAVAKATSIDGPHLVHMKIKPGSLKKLGRPTIKPHEVAQRFKNYLES